MSADTKRFVSAATQFIHIDYIHKRGQRATIGALTIAALLVCLLFAWLGARRAHILLAGWADRQLQARQYAAAAQSYTLALRFDGSDAHALLSRGRARQQIAADAAALEDFSRYIALQPDDAAGYLGRGASQARPESFPRRFPVRNILFWRTQH